MSRYVQHSDEETSSRRPKSFFGKLHAPRPPSRGRPTRRGQADLVPSIATYDEHADLRYSEALDEEAEAGRGGGLVNKIGKVGKGGVAQVKKQIQQKHGVERAVLCAVAVLLLWATSLVVCKSIVESFILRPSTSNVRYDVENAFNVTFDYKDQHERCAYGARERCEISFQQSLDLEYDRVQVIEHENADYLVSLNTSRTLCDEAISLGISYLKSYRDSNSFEDMKKANAPETCINVNSIIDGNEAAVDSYNAADQYSKNQATTTKQVFERGVYDATYFGGKFDEVTGASQGVDSAGGALNGTATNLLGIADTMSECVNISPGTQLWESSGCDATIEGKLNEAVQSAQDELTSIRNSATSKLEDYQETINRVSQFFDDIKDVVPPNTFPSLDVPGVSLPGSVDAQLESVRNAMDSAKDDMQQKIEDMKAGILDPDAGLAGAYKKIEEEKEKIKELFSDYDPPPMPEDLTVEQVDQEREEFMVSIANSLENIDQVEIGDIRSQVANSNSSSLQAVEVRANTLAVRDWDFYVYPDIFAEEFFGTWDRIVQLSLSFDYVYRVLKSLMLIRKYWNISAISTPPSDVRVKSSVGDTSAKANRNPAQQAAYIATHPAFMAITSIVFLAIITASFLALYLPFFFKYTEACVEANADDQIGDGNFIDNGTFIVENAYTIAFQYSVSDGDKIGAVQLDKVSQQREAACDFQRENSTAVYQSDVTFFATVANSYTADRSAREQIVECLDLDKINAAISSVDIYDFFGDDSECAKGVEIVDELENSIFQCGAISTCKEDFQCVGPDVSALYRTVREAGCSTEWLMHSALLGFIMSGLTFCLLNLSRILLMRGFIRIYWRHLTGDKFAYIATCYENGELEYPEKVTDEGYSFKALIRDNLAIQLRAFTHWGYYMMMLAFAINLPWIGVLLTLGTSLEFKPSS